MVMVILLSNVSRGVEQLSKTTSTTKDQKIKIIKVNSHRAYYVAYTQSKYRPYMYNFCKRGNIYKIGLSLFFKDWIFEDVDGEYR